MERSRTSQLMAIEASVANSTAFALSTGKEPGRPRQTGQTLVLGAEPKWLAQPQKTLVAVSSCTWTSSPMTGSYLARISGERAAADILAKILARNHGASSASKEANGRALRGLAGFTLRAEIYGLMFGQYSACLSAVQCFHAP